MSSFQSTLLSLIGMFAGLLLAAGVGALAHASYAARVAHQRRQPPEQWPMRPRTITNSEERVIGRWLALAFADQSLMVKMPVTRFTTPDTPANGLHWYELLGSLYCTFTVVRDDGRVVGCLDIHSQRMRAQRSQKMKRQLLKQCGLPYLVVEPHNLPDALALRRAFLGVEAFVRNGQYQSADTTEAINEASTRLQNVLTRSRQTRHSDVAPLTNDVGADSSMLHDASSFSTQWQDNSFIAPLDSRVGGL